MDLLAEKVYLRQNNPMEFKQEPYLFKEMETDRLKLIKIAPEQINDIFNYASHRKVVKYLSWPRHKNRKQTGKFIEMTVELYEEECHYDWAIWHREDQKVIGTMGLHTRNRQDNSVEIGFVLARQYWGRGLVPEGAARLCDFIFRDLKIGILRATCHPDNLGSERVMQKLNMSFQGLEPVNLIKSSKPVIHKVYALERSFYLSRQN